MAWTPAHAQVTELTAQDLLNLIDVNQSAQVFGTPDDSPIDPATNADLQAVINATGANQVYDIRSFSYALTGQGIIRYRTTGDAQSLGWPGSNDSYLSQSNHAFAMMLEDQSGQAVGTVYSYHDIVETGSEAGDNSYGGVFVTSFGQFTNTYDPPLLQYKTPLTYDPATTWSDQTNGGSTSITGEVEGYGTLRTPAGDYEVMRIRRDYGGSFATTDYEFISPDIGFTVATIEGQGDGTFVVTFTAASDDFAETTVASGATGSILSDNRASVSFTSGSSASGSLSIATYNQSPYNAAFDGQSATSGDGTTITPDVLWEGQYYAITNVDDQLSGFDATVCLDVSGVPGVAAIDKLVLLTRASSGQEWTPLNTAVSGTQICASVTSFSQFAVGSASQYNTLPVELTRFTATAGASAVLLEWATAGETNNSGFAVERQVDGDAFARIAFVEGHGTTAAPQTYRFADTDLPFGTEHAVYRLKQIDTDGTATYSPNVEVDLGTPDALVLHGNFPNPFRGQTTIRYELPAATHVQMEVYNVLGRRV
ncbi:MAG: hypothetical protein GVY35_02630, partial [Bacteroidetes bacterium]|nr:hypothetical protein [Bacteroidota bacterium]